MPPVSILEFLLFFVSLLLEAALIGMVVAWGWALQRLVRGLPVLPEDAFLTLPMARWGLGTVLLVVLLHVGAGSAAGVACRELFGIDLGQLVAREKPPVPIHDVGAEPAARNAEGPDARRSSASARQLMIWNASYNALFLMAFPWFFRRASGADAKELGLSLERWPEQLRLGVVAGLIAAPLIYAIQFLSLTIFEVNAHPIEQMLQEGFDGGLAMLALVSTVVLAPLTEELMFRGVLQGWLTRAWSTLTAHPSRTSPPGGAGSMPPQDQVGPPTSAARPGEGSGSRPVAAPNRICWPAVVVTSCLFAALHGPQWPAPIALFFFSMIMGALYQHSGSLIASIAIHGLFNGCSTLLLLTQQLARSVQQPDVEVGAAVGGVAAIWDVLLQISR
ncbi:CPBP family intramembrane glutamic endopeptidase [Paludisphaera soli]|uniref:CPBP family intramembrane glutamic endopeptidase n=1 Tax=Paludisphaera soli TaxID=2712865 RepID=UPI0013EABAC3|nr:CPBP family intramembrane glutamic endopeptidase [Paludisphaera soli]